MSSLQVQASTATPGIDAKEQTLEDENRLLFDQLMVVQEELERLHHSGRATQSPVAGTKLRWVDDGLPELQAEHVRNLELLKAQREVHRLESEYSLAARLGHILIQADASPSSMLAVPGSLYRVWRQSRQQVPPKSLGGKEYVKVIAAYDDGGVKAVEHLLQAAAVSPIVQANAWTALARGLMHKDVVAAADAARRAHAVDPRAFRLKWLAFRLHEAGELLESEAMLALLPLDINFSDSEVRQAERLKMEAKEFRLSQAKLKSGYAEQRAAVEALAIQREKELSALANQVSELTQSRDMQAARCMQLETETIALQKQLADERHARDELLQQMGQQLKQMGRHLKLLVDQTEQRSGIVDAHFKKQGDDLIRVRKFMAETLKKRIDNSARQTQAFIGLQDYFSTGELPVLNAENKNWPVSPDFSFYLVQLIELNKYDVIIEFGSGLSTVVVARSLAKMIKRGRNEHSCRFVSFDHLEAYYQQTQAHLLQAGLADDVQLCLTPLQDWVAPNGITYPYYSCQSVLKGLASERSLDGLRVLVIVDGPPAATGEHARYPAGPLILQHFTGAHIDILLDDYIREDEKEIAQIWQAEIQEAGLTCSASTRQLEKAACLITIDPQR